MKYQFMHPPPLSQEKLGRKDYSGIQRVFCVSVVWGRYQVPEAVMVPYSTTNREPGKPTEKSKGGSKKIKF